MRLRFSLRLVFALITLSAIALYCFVVRPTMLAQKFVVAVSRQDYGAAKQLMIGEATWRRIVEQHNFPAPDRIYAELVPREWQDVWRGRRRILFRVARHNDFRGAHVEWTEDTDFVAGARGLDAPLTGRINYNWPAIKPPESTITNPSDLIRLEWNVRQT